MKTYLLPLWRWLTTGYGTIVSAFGIVIVLSQAQEAVSAIEWALPAHRGYVRDVLLSKQTDDAVRTAQAESSATQRFDRIESLLLQQNADTLEGKLAIMRPQLISLMDLLERNPGDQQIRLQIVTMQADIANTERKLQLATCAVNTRGAPNFGCAQ